LLTVGNSTAGVESLLSVTACFRVLAAAGGWAGAWSRGPAPGCSRRAGLRLAVRPRRARCSSCGTTHVFFPAWLLARRCDGTAVIGGHAGAGGPGSGVPVDRGRVRGAAGHRSGTGLRRFRSSAGRVRERFTRLAGVLAVDPVPLDPAGSVAGDAVVAVAAAAAAAAGRWPALTVSAWELAGRVHVGSLLSPAVVFRPVREDMLASALG